MPFFKFLYNYISDYDNSSVLCPMLYIWQKGDMLFFLKSFLFIIFIDIY